MREKIYKIIEVHDSESLPSKIYNIINIIIILVSLLPLMFKQQTEFLFLIDGITVTFFIIEYILHIVTADYAYPEKSGIKPFLLYPVSIYGIIDLLSILPSFDIVSSNLRLLRLFRLARSLRVFRAFKLFRYSKSTTLLLDTIKEQKNNLIFIAGLTILYILLTALILFNVEPELFTDFIEALSWSTMSLTTATYGNTYPTSFTGQVFSMVSLLVGVIVIALPTSIITAGYVDKIEEYRKEEASENLQKETENISVENDDLENIIDKLNEKEKASIENKESYHPEDIKRLIDEVLEEKEKSKNN